jgi:hypothetical protein
MSTEEALALKVVRYAEKHLGDYCAGHPVQYPLSPELNNVDVLLVLCAYVSTLQMGLWEAMVYRDGNRESHSLLLVHTKVLLFHPRLRKQEGEESARLDLGSARVLPFTPRRSALPSGPYNFCGTITP